jgi:hypothetical protein
MEIVRAKASFKATTKLKRTLIEDASPFIVCSKLMLQKHSTFARDSLVINQ